MKQYTMCKFSDKHMPQEYQGNYPFSEGELFIYHGEIHDMEGHCIVSRYPSGEIISGFHTDLFTQVEV